MGKVAGLFLVGCIIAVGCGSTTVAPTDHPSSTTPSATEAVPAASAGSTSAPATTDQSTVTAVDAVVEESPEPISEISCEMSPPELTSPDLAVSDEWRLEQLPSLGVFDYQATWSTGDPVECGGRYLFVPLMLDGPRHEGQIPTDAIADLFMPDTVGWHLGLFAFTSDHLVAQPGADLTGSFSIWYETEMNLPEGTYNITFQIVDTDTGASSPAYEIPFYIGREFDDPDGGPPRSQPSTLTASQVKQIAGQDQEIIGSEAAFALDDADPTGPCEVAAPRLVVDEGMEAPVMDVEEEWYDDGATQQLIVDYWVEWGEDNPEGCAAEYVIEPVSVLTPRGYTRLPSGEMPGIAETGRASWFLVHLNVTSDVLVSGGDSIARFTLATYQEVLDDYDPGTYTVAVRVVERRTGVASAVYEIPYHLGLEFTGPDGDTLTQPSEVEATCADVACDQAASGFGVEDATTGWEPDPADLAPGEGWNPGVFLPRHCTFESDLRAWVGDEGWGVLGSSGTGVWERISDRASVSNDDGVRCEPDWIMQLRMEAGLTRDPESPDSIFGSSYYVRVFPFFDEVPDSGQWGVWGQWIGDSGAHPNSPFNSIEGGLFIADKMGRSRFPKYMIGSATHLYSGDSDATGGWGFYETRIDCGLLGRITLTNRVLVPPNLLGFDEYQDSYDEEDGIFFGNAWVALPVLGGRSRSGGDTPSTDNGRLTWTFVADAANYSGPLVGYVPEHWSRRVDRWSALEVLDDVYEWNDNDPVASLLIDFIDGIVDREELYRGLADEPFFTRTVDDSSWGDPFWTRPESTLGFMPARGHISMGAEMAEVPVFIEQGDDGRLFAKVFPPFAPSVKAREPIVLNAQTYDVGLYNHFVDVFGGDTVPEGFDTGFDDFGYPMRTERWTPGHNIRTDDGTQGRFVDESDWSKIRAAEHAEADLRLRIPANSYQVGGESNVYVDWGDSSPDERGWGSFYEIVGAVPVEPDWEEFSDEAVREMEDGGIDIGARLTISGLHPDDYQVLPVSAEEVPASMRDLRYSTLRNPTTVVPHEIVTQDDYMISEGYTPDYSCYQVCELSGGCDPVIHEVEGDDGGRISYRWYRFINQPAFRDLRLEYPDAYNDVYLEGVQATIEAMHAAWQPDQPFLERPASVDSLHLAELDDALIVTPPAGKEHGWVPIVLGVDFEDGVPQHGINVRETPRGYVSR